MEKHLCVERWDCLELAFAGPSDGNPFTDYSIRGTFQGEHVRIADHTRVIDQFHAFDRICCFATEYAGQVSRKHGIIFLQA